MQVPLPPQPKRSRSQRDNRDGQRNVTEEHPEIPALQSQGTPERCVYSPDDDHFVVEIRNQKAAGNRKSCDHAVLMCRLVASENENQATHQKRARQAVQTRIQQRKIHGNLLTNQNFHSTENLLNGIGHFTLDNAPQVPRAIHQSKRCRVNKQIVNR